MPPKPQGFADDRMGMHENASVTPKGREAMARSVIEGGLSKANGRARSIVGSAIGSRAIAPVRATLVGSAGNCASGDRRPRAPRGDPPDEKPASCLRFLFNALRFFRGFGVRVERVMTDNGSSFRSGATPRRCAGSKSSICARNLIFTPPKSTATPSASSRPACANGPTPALTTPPRNALPNSPSGCTAITGIAIMAISAPTADQQAHTYRGQRLEAQQLEHFLLKLRRILRRRDSLRILAE
jgi:hypothetical protein